MPQLSREAQRLVAASSHDSQSSIGSSASSAPPSRQLQSVYDTYAENIHAISMRSSQHPGNRSYGALDSVASTTTSTSSRPRRSRRRRKSGTARSASSSFACEAGDPLLSAWQTGFHVVSFMAGSGLVFLPLALVEMSWFGVLVLLAAAAIAMYTTHLLLEAMETLRWSSGGARVSLGDLSRACFGGSRVAALLTNMLMHGGFLFSATGYLALVASCLAGITGATYRVMLGVVTGAVWFHVLVPSWRALALFSAINVAVCFWIEAVIFGDAMYPLKDIALSDDEAAFTFGAPDLRQSPVLVQLAYSFLLLVSGFYCHALLPLCYEGMTDRRQCRVVVRHSQCVVLFMLYLPICVVSYAVYGSTLQAPVFFNMRNTVVRTLAIVLYCIHVLLSYTINVYPLHRVLEQTVLPSQTPRRSADDRRLLAASLRSIVQGQRQGGHDHELDLPLITTAAASANGPPPANEQDEIRRQRWERVVRVLCRSVVVLLTTALAYALEPTTLGTFAGMIVPVATVALILPCIFYWKLCADDVSRVDRVAIPAILLLAVASTITSLSVVFG